MKSELKPVKLSPWQVPMVNRAVGVPEEDLSETDPEQYLIDNSPVFIRRYLGGKTGRGDSASILMAYKLLRQYNWAQKGMLVVGSLRTVLDTWPNDIEGFEDFKHFKYSVIHGTQIKKSLAMPPGYDVYLINAEGLAWIESATHGFLNVPWDVICVDDATQFKNPDSNRTKILQSMIKRTKPAAVWSRSGDPDALDLAVK